MTAIITAVTPSPIIDGSGSNVATYNTDMPSDHTNLFVTVGYVNGSGTTVTATTSIAFGAGSTFSFVSPFLGVSGTVTGFVKIVHYVAADTYTDVSDPFAVQIRSAPAGSGTVSLSTVSPAPLVAGETVTLTGPDVGICDMATVGYLDTANGVTVVHQLAVPLTFIDQNTSTFVVPDLVLDRNRAGFVRATYTINGAVATTNSLAVGLAPVPNTQPNVPPATPTYGYGIPDEDMAYPSNRVPWKFTDPYDPDSATNTYLFPVNPSKMTSPYPSRTINAAFTTARTGQVLLTEGARKPAQWQFSGTIFRGAHYDMLRSWVYERKHRVIVTDHFGRDIECVLLNFDPQPTKQDKRKFWLHTYTITAIVTNVGEPTEVPS